VSVPGRTFRRSAGHGDLFVPRTSTPTRGPHSASQYLGVSAEICFLCRSAMPTCRKDDSATHRKHYCSIRPTGKIWSRLRDAVRMQTSALNPSLNVQPRENLDSWYCDSGPQLAVSTVTTSFHGCIKRSGLDDWKFSRLYLFIYCMNRAHSMQYTNKIKVCRENINDKRMTERKGSMKKVTHKHVVAYYW